MRGAPRLVSALGAALLASGCPFSPTELNTADFYCGTDADCAGEQACGTPIGATYRRCVAKDVFCANDEFEPGMGETDFNCGGPCQPCRDSMVCEVDADCGSHVSALLGDTPRCVPSPESRQVSGRYTAQTCNCPAGELPPCGTPDCMPIEVCDGMYCRAGCNADADCPLHSGSNNFCANQVCAPGGVSCPATTAFFCSVGQPQRWGFATCQDGTEVVCTPLPLQQ